MCALICSTSRKGKDNNVSWGRIWLYCTENQGKSTNDDGITFIELPWISLLEAMLENMTMYKTSTTTDDSLLC